MSLTEDERWELERLRKSYRKRMAKDEFNNKLAWGLSKGMALAITFNYTILHFTPDTRFWRIVDLFSILVCFAMGILSSYYGPFADKKKVIEDE